MKKYFLFFVSIFAIPAFSQTFISGHVIDSDSIPLWGASVYLNNTTIGTGTDKNGAFEFEVGTGSHTLIISFIGYNTIQYPISISDNTNLNSLIFKLEVDQSMLKEVVIRETKYDDEWQYNLSRFTQAFLGRTNLAKECIITNPKVLNFDYNSETDALTAYATGPLLIKNKGLGYTITYDLVNFKIEGNRLSYVGFAKYELLKGHKKRWNINRLKAYRGSQIHFFKSLYEETLHEEGYIVNQFKRLPNPERPSEEEIKEARKIIRSANEPINFSTNLAAPKTKIDSAKVILKKTRLSKYIDYLYKKDVPYSDIKTLDKGTVLINFKDYLSITYTKEEEEDNWLQNGFTRRKKTGVQTSAIVMLTKTAILDRTGIIINPLDILVEGYWSYEQFGNSLPLDYYPK